MTAGSRGATPGRRSAAPADLEPSPLTRHPPCAVGLEVFRRVRRNSGTPVIVVAGRTISRDVVAGLESGAGDLEIRPEDGVVHRDGRRGDGTRTEFRLLCALVAASGGVLSRGELLARVRDTGTWVAPGRPTSTSGDCGRRSRSALPGRGC